MSIIREALDKLNAMTSEWNEARCLECPPDTWSIERPMGLLLGVKDQSSRPWHIILSLDGEGMYEIPITEEEAKKFGWDLNKSDQDNQKYVGGHFVNMEAFKREVEDTLGRPIEVLGIGGIGDGD